MEASDLQEKLTPDHEMELSEDFFARLRFTTDSQFIGDMKVPQENGAMDNSGCNTEDEDEDEDDFSFVCGGELISPVAAGDAFADGQIKPVFPLFKQELLLLSDCDSASSSGSPIKKVFVESPHPHEVSNSSTAGNDEITGPYCEWSDRKAMELSQQQACTKSNSTGFSKIWRLKEFRARCNSDGKDAFVFLNNGNRAKKPAEQTTEESKRKVKKDAKCKKVPLSAHEVYLKSKQKDGEQRRRRSPTYLPYRPELVGFFTTLNTGLTKNVHPF